MTKIKRKFCWKSVLHFHDKLETSRCTWHPRWCFGCEIEKEPSKI